MRDVFDKPTEKQVQRAIKALAKAHEALSPIVLGSPDDTSDGVVRLRRDIGEFSDYLEKARWWRKEKS